MCKIGWWKLVQNVNHDAMQTFNKMHVRVEWGINGVRRKWKCLMKRLDSTKPKYVDIFQAIVMLLTSYIKGVWTSHMRWLGTKISI